jgi:Flp pilus assembly protein TadD
LSSKAVGLAAAFLLLPAVRASADASREFDALSLKAVRLEEKGRYAGAVETLKEALALRPDEYALRMRLARDYIRLGRLELAREQFQSARKIDPKQAEAYIEEGYADEQAGEHAAAERSFSDLVSVDTASPVGYHHLGAFLSLNGRPAEAERSLREALKRLKADPRSTAHELAHTIQWLGNAVRAQGRFSEAAALFDEGLARSAGMPGWRTTFLADLGDLSLAQGRDAEAEGYYNRGRASCDGEPFSDGCADVLFALVDFYAERERKGDAQSAADALLAYSPLEFAGSLPQQGVDNTPERFGKLGLECRKLGLVPEAEKAYRRVLSYSYLPSSSESVNTAKRALADLQRRPSP